RILRPGGVFWATTPHSHGLSARCLGLEWSIVVPPEHLQLFSAYGIKLLMRDAGFNRARVQTHAVDPFELIAFVKRRYTRRRRAEERTSVEPAEPLSRADLNEYLTASAPRRLLKEAANTVLNATRLGDSLKIVA